MCPSDDVAMVMLPWQCCHGDGSPGGGGGGGGGGGEKAVDVSRLDFRIGRILKAWKHPDDDTLYVEEGERRGSTMEPCFTDTPE